MRKIELYTFFKADGTTQLLYGYSPDDALTEAGYSTSWIAENILDWRRGYSNELVFKDGKWKPRDAKTSFTPTYPNPN